MVHNQKVDVSGRYCDCQEGLSYLKINKGEFICKTIFAILILMSDSDSEVDERTKLIMSTHVEIQENTERDTRDEPSRNRSEGRLSPTPADGHLPNSNLGTAFSNPRDREQVSNLK